MTPTPRDAAIAALELCSACQGYGWVCEAHPDKSWNDGECCGAPGEPCRICNPCTKDIPPRNPIGFKECDDE